MKLYKLNPLFWISNQDSGSCGEKTDKEWFAKNCNNICNLKCKVKWFIRNPFHNFMFYIIGFADEPVASKCTKDNFWNPDGGWNFCLRNKYFPFISYRGKHLETYFGWRERGNFGIAFRIKRDK